MEKFDNILIIDDDQINNFLFSRIIKTAAVSEHTETVTSARKGLDLLEKKIVAGEKLPDIIFLDINMPLMNGWEFLDKYQKFPEKIRKEINLYMLSSSDYHEDINKAKQYEDVVDYIVKPLTKEILFKIQTDQMTKDGRSKNYPK